jgi:hypothetical protein
VKPINKREVPLVPDNASVTKKRKLSDALDLIYKIKKRIPAYEKLDFPEIPIIFNFIYKETKNPRELFIYFFPDSELQTIAEHTNINIDL